ncbi:chorismate synthase, partial [Nevskia sp.]|uniref:chorismate synthase n=1 Tax=Nevskia sp. TaxID=1929292 RepID=UPI0026012E22
IKDVFRPNHADYAYTQKYGFRDPRGGGRSSARETAVRVAAAAIAKKWLQQKFGIEIRGWCAQIGEHPMAVKDWAQVEQNPFFCGDVEMIPTLEAYIDQLRRDGDSVGARVNVIATKVPPGLGEPVFDRLDAELAFGLMSINAVKGVEIGDGFGVINQRGTEGRDEMTPEGFLANHSGGVSGGSSTGQDIVCWIAIKPTSSITTPGKTIDSDGNATEMRTTGRHDPCVGIRATPIAEAMVALVLMDHALRQRGQNGDVVVGTPVIPA